MSDRDSSRDSSSSRAPRRPPPPRSKMTASRRRVQNMSKPLRQSERIRAREEAQAAQAARAAQIALAAAVPEPYRVNRGVPTAEAGPEVEIVWQRSERSGHRHDHGDDPGTE